MSKKLVGFLMAAIMTLSLASYAVAGEGRDFRGHRDFRWSDGGGDFGGFR